MEKKNYLQIIIINYGNWDITLKCVKSLVGQNASIVVLDNFFDSNSRKKNTELIQIIKNLGAMLVFYNENYGYLGAAQKYLNGNNVNMFDWTIIMNNDVVLKEGNFFNYLKETDNNTSIWAVAPSIKELNGKELNPYFKNSLSKSKKFFFKLFFSNFLLAKLILKTRKLVLPEKIEKSEYEKNIFSMNGAVFILKNELVKLVLATTPLSFLYGEETLITEIITSQKKIIHFTNSLKFIHEHSVTIGKKLSKNKFNWMKKAYKESIKRGYKFYN